MNWTLTPDQFALAWERTDGDRIPYPLAVRLSARDTVERAAQLPDLNSWCDRVLDADLEAALRVLARPTVRLEVYGEHNSAAEPDRGRSEEHRSVLTGAALGAESLGVATVSDAERATIGTNGTVPAHDPRTVRVLGATAGHIAVVAAQRPGSAPDRGGDIRLFVGGPKSLAARVVSTLPDSPPGAAARLTAPLPRVREDSRDLVTVPVAGPTAPARIRRLLNRPRDGIGQIVVSARRADGELRPFGVLCWIDVAGDGRYTVRTGADVDVAPVDAEAFTAHLRPMLNAAGKTSANAERLRDN
ncbi:ESX secretion-associated protein EspG [Nocardia sp. NPDC050710]|uniref:ESX secretion-associated protein EspG n=1 Tax=Nocardia sp. NPDC050710 TaxID=3157220 RepID=UPI00340F21AD